MAACGITCVRGSRKEQHDDGGRSDEDCTSFSPDDCTYYETICSSIETCTS